METDTIWPQMKQTMAVSEPMAPINNEVDFIDIGMNLFAMGHDDKLN